MVSPFGPCMYIGPPRESVVQAPVFGKANDSQLRVFFGVSLSILSSCILVSYTPTRSSEFRVEVSAWGVRGLS